LVLATRNGHKLREFQRLLDGAPGAPAVVLEELAADVVLPPEDGDTFAENALGKARAAAAATGRVAIADDSGIEAAALGGAPGVRSARFAGEDASDTQNLDKLLREAPSGSALEYVCAIAYVDPAPGGIERVFEGRCSGRLAAQPRGERGFGYDPAFVPDDDPPPDESRPGSPRDDREAPKTMAQLSDEQKDAISHRGRAARALLAWLA
jgi:XTP/dITP diphosphohydrolase